MPLLLELLLMLLLCGCCRCRTIAEQGAGAAAVVAPAAVFALAAATAERAAAGAASVPTVVDGRQEQSSTRLKNQFAPAARNDTCHALKYSSMWEATRSREGVAVITDSRQVGTVLLVLLQ